MSTVRRCLPTMISDFLRRRLLRLCGLGVAAGLWAVTAMSWAQMLVVLSDETTSYQQVAEELRAGVKSVREGRVRIDVVTAERVTSGDDQVLKSYELVVTVGLAAARAVIAREGTLTTAPLTLCLLIPRQAFEQIATARTDGRDHRLSAVFIDQPLARQLELLRLALPGRDRVGIVLGPSSATLTRELRDRARERDLTPNIVEITESSHVYGALQQVLPASDVLLALPDPAVFNSSTVYGLLLTSYRAQVPVVGFSDGLVKAGALLGLFSTASQVGKQGAEIAGRVLGGAQGLPAPSYPRYFTVRVNYTVARSLGLALEEEATLAAALAARGDGRREGPRPGSVIDSTVPGKTP